MLLIGFEIWGLLLEMWVRVSCAFLCLDAIKKLGAFLVGLGAILGFRN